MLCDVFVRVSPFNDIREGMWMACEARWRMEPITLHTLSGFEIRRGRLIAENEAKSAIYIFSDDDVLILGKNWVKRATEIMLRHPEYAIVSTLSMIEGENLAKPQDWQHDQEIYDMHYVGAPMLIRKGVLGDLPEMDLNNECGKLHDLVASKGFKEGLINPNLALRSNHLGHGFSSNPGLAWGM